MDPIDHFYGEYNQEQLVGSCNECKETELNVSTQTTLPTVTCVLVLCGSFSACIPPSPSSCACICVEEGLMRPAYV